MLKFGYCAAVCYCLSIAFLTTYTAFATVTRPARLDWAIVADSIDPDFALTSLGHYLGLKAAEHYINSNDLLNGTALNFTFVRGLSFAATLPDAVALLANLTALAPFGYVLPDWVNSDLVINFTASAGGVTPVVHPETTSQLFYGKQYRHTLFLRQPFTIEHVGLLNYAVDAKSLCSYSAVIGQEFSGSDQLLAALAEALVALQQPSPILVTVTTAEFYTQNFTSMVAKVFSTSPKIPGCIFMYGLSVHIQGYIDALWGDARLDREHTYFFATSAANSMRYNSSIYGTAPYANLRITFTLPSPTNPTVPSVSAYQAAFDAYVSTYPTIPSSVTQAIPPSTVTLFSSPGIYSYSSFDGFVTGMFVAQVLMSTPDVTPQAFLQQVYRQKFVTMNEMLIGPFSDACLANGTMPQFPCFCNTGGRSFHVAEVNSTTGFIVGATADATLNDGSQLSITAPLGRCQLATSDILKPLNMGMIFSLDTILSSDGLASYQLFAETLITAATYANEYTDISSYGRLNTLVDVYASIPNSDALLANITTRYNPYVLIGGTVSSGTSGIPSFFRLALSMPVQDPELTTATKFSQYEFNFTPVLADYIHALASYLVSAAGLNEPSAGGVVNLAYDTATIRSLMQKSMHTFQLDPTVWTDLSSSARISSYVDWAIYRASQQQRSILFVASLNTTLCVALLEEIATAATASLLTAAQRASMVVLVAAPELFVFYSGQYLTANALAIPSGVVVLLASVMGEWWTPTSQIYQGLYALTGSTTIANHPAAATGFLAGTLLYSSTRSITSSSGATGATLLETIYSSGTISSFGFSYGPLYNRNCTDAIISSQSVARTCQCFKGPRTFYVVSFNDFVGGTSGSTGSYFFAMTTCGVEYLPLFVASSLNAALVGGVVAAGGTVLVGSFGFLLYMATRPKRDNRAAPKDPTKPFAMVFTDIQSSTSLWARAPEFMGPSVERHHAEIRKLLGKYRGYEVKTIGDSFMIAFQDSRDAASLALAIQSTFYGLEWPKQIDDTYRSLALEAAESAVEEGKPASMTLQAHTEDDELYRSVWNGIRVRVGMNWGYASIQLDPVSQGYDYYGTLVNTAARVEGVGNGGQVLCTKDFYDELERAQFDFDAVDITPLGPQPLRGLDAPVPLFQLNPVALKARTFNPLRLDVENVADDGTEMSEDHTTNPETASRGSGMSMSTATADQIAERLMRSKKLPPFFVDAALDKDNFLQVLLSTSPASWRNDTLGALTKKWQIHIRHPLPSETPEHYELVKRIHLIAKVVLAQEEQRKANKTFGHRQSTLASHPMGSVNLTTPLYFKTPVLTRGGGQPHATTFQEAMASGGPTSDAPHDAHLGASVAA